MTSTQAISQKAVEQLKDLTIIPQVVGYNHEIRELDDARLIQWIAGEGYFISDAGRSFLAKMTG